jgi:hypothetical protein
MANPITCDARSVPPNAVASPGMISMFVGNPPRELMIFTGTAIVDWKSRSDLDRTSVVVLLPGLATPRFQWTSTASLASILNTDSDMLFAVDASSVVLGPGGLELHMDIAVQGDDSVLHRISYHAQVLTDPVTAKIAGTIRWKRSLGDPIEAAMAPHITGVNMFGVAAGAFVSTPGSGGGFGSTKWIEAASTFTTSVPVLAGDTWAVAYVIENVPLGVQYAVVPALLDGVLTQALPNPVFTPAPRYVELTPNDPAVTGVDFEMTAGGGVR